MNYSNSICQCTFLFVRNNFISGNVSLSDICFKPLVSIVLHLIMCIYKTENPLVLIAGIKSSTNLRPNNLQENMKTSSNTSIHKKSKSWNPEPFKKSCPTTNLLLWPQANVNSRSKITLISTYLWIVVDRLVGSLLITNQLFQATVITFA